MGCLLETLGMLLEDLYIHLMERILPQWKLSARTRTILGVFIDTYAILLLVNVIIGGVCWLLGFSGAKLVVLISLALILLQIGIGCIVQAFNKK